MQVFKNLLSKQSERAEKGKGGDVKDYKRNLKIKLKLCKLYAGIAVWAKQEGILYDLAVQEIAGLKHSITALIDLFFPKSNTNVLHGKTLKQYVTS